VKPAILWAQLVIMVRALPKAVLAANPQTQVIVVDAAPVVGALLLGLDALNAHPTIEHRLRTLLSP
jgi:hypothetical protein